MSKQQPKYAPDHNPASIQMFKIQEFQTEMKKEMDADESEAAASETSTEEQPVTSTPSKDQNTT